MGSQDLSVHLIFSKLRVDLSEVEQKVLNFVRLARRVLEEVQKRNWLEAQNVQFSLDLVSEAEYHLGFVAKVHSNPWLFSTQILRRAIERYEYCWLPLANSSSELIPPLDCALIWHCHRLKPVQYASDCRKLFGKVIDARLKRKNSMEHYRKSRDAWTSLYPDEPYNFRELMSTGSSSYSSGKSMISYNLVDAVKRQKSFIYQVSAPHYQDRGFLRDAEKRYKGFLHLKRTQGEDKFFVPTYDIDLMWHTHQLCSVKYECDMVRVLGRDLEHDDSVNNREVGGKLDVGYTQTRSLWEETYGLTYEKAGCMYRGEPPLPLTLISTTSVRVLGSSLAECSRSWAHLQATLAKRKIFQVHMSVREVESYAEPREFNHLLAISPLNSLLASSFKFHDFNSSKKIWDFETDLSTQGVILELKPYSGSYTVLGHLRITWQQVMMSEMHSISGWFPLQNTRKPTSLQLVASMTPPVTGQFFLRSVKTRDTKDDRGDIWLTKCILDHTNCESYVVRYKHGQASSLIKRKPPRAQRFVHVHHGVRKFVHVHDRNSLYVPDVSGEVIGSAFPLEKTANSRSWSLLDGAVTLTISRYRKESKWWPQFDVRTRLDCPDFVLVPGRKPQLGFLYDPGFMTMVRYTRDEPEGIATALFDLDVGHMQIDRTRMCSWCCFCRRLYPSHSKS
ncbi:uncharacterized protein LOC112349147 isoform X2 [Selaginella moellendorffii]|uniref:uncharacterized protein LOC112349147 isoform X2 n=1 Tax=Selaginella moellendorffii TaxID=88036 RepID=UPI000D1C2338|nr:uncharacterized protein LOC112349147 isoform X2 [Selaginella moellendorffii]|eukprot:XP_024538724.1 uncharacterized protein LOC112349147 isoform X2 [Selaginella moellendorffii]